MKRSHAVATGHPAATAAAVGALEDGGSAADAAIAAQAVICVVMPHAAGLGGDMLALSRSVDGYVSAMNGTGRSPILLDPAALGSGDALPGMSVTVPGIVAGWSDLHAGAGRLDLDDVLAAAFRLAHEGFTVDGSLAHALEMQRPRITAVSPASPLADLRLGDRWIQPELATTLHRIGRESQGAVQQGELAEAAAAAVRRAGGWMTTADLGDHSTEIGDPVTVPWDGGTVAVQPPHSQGVLLAMALSWLDEDPDRWQSPDLSHLLIELTEAVFEHRDDCALGAALLGRHLTVDAHRAARRGGPRPYLHTAGVAVATSDGDVVSSLVSVFDDFGSCVWVPEGGFMLNNRADGFTSGRNAAAPASRPVHTLAPIIVTDRFGQVTALATPGADGQVQTLLQVLCAQRRDGASLPAAIAAPRWRSHDSHLVIEPDHPDIASLLAAGHETVLEPRGDDLFGSVVAAGVDARGAHATADWRRQSTATTTERTSS